MAELRDRLVHGIAPWRSADKMRTMAHVIEKPTFTGLKCLKCREPIATVDHVGPQGLRLNCPGCAHQWMAREQTPESPSRCGPGIGKRGRGCRNPQ